MRKKGLHQKLIGCALAFALALTSIGISQPAQIEAAEYYEDNWRGEGTVSVHDPSIVVGFEKDGKTLGTQSEGSTKVYYIFGSHRAFAKSYDLQNWETFENNISSDYRTIFTVENEWSAMGDATYDLSGNLWAPDVIWNKDMGKWCMYMSINGRSWNSTIALLTADSLDGDWTYIDTVIYSGFTNKDYNHDYTLTDYQKVTGDTELADRYISGSYTSGGGTPTTWNTDYGAHAIDPCVLYDDEGNLWMSYGSWSGGIYMIGLDEATGLRDYDQKYETVENESDAYMGIQLGGGKFVSGEASYIQKIGDYYYMFITYGGLTANGGYNVRCFRSDKITGPYVDDQGYPAIFKNRSNNINGIIGQRMMTYYQWSWQSYGEIAQGHNSAFVDTDGKAYIVYHTRALYHGEEHKVRVHQLYQNENGWLVEAPLAYAGETIKQEGYAAEEITGTYEVILHKPTVYGSKEVMTGVDVTLRPDGTVFCATDKNYIGNWKQTDGSCYMTITMGDTTYRGVFATGVVEGSDNDETMCFTAVADENTMAENSGICAWGVKLSEGLSSYLEGNLKLTKSKVSIVKGKTAKVKVYDEAYMDTFLKKAVWKSSNTKVAKVNSNGKITAKKVGTAKITATVGNKTMTCKVTVTAAKKTTKKK